MTLKINEIPDVIKITNLMSASRKAEDVIQQVSKALDLLQNIKPKYLVYKAEKDNLKVATSSLTSSYSKIKKFKTLVDKKVKKLRTKTKY